MARYEFLVLVLLFAFSDYFVADNHLLWTTPHHFMYYNFNVFQDYSPSYYYSIYGNYRPIYSRYSATDNLSLWISTFIVWINNEQYSHEFFYYAMFGKYRPFLFFNI